MQKGHKRNGAEDRTDEGFQEEQQGGAKRARQEVAIRPVTPEPEPAPPSLLSGRLQATGSPRSVYPGPGLIDHKPQPVVVARDIPEGTFSAPVTIPPSPLVDEGAVNEEPLLSGSDGLGNSDFSVAGLFDDEGKRLDTPEQDECFNTLGLGEWLVVCSE